MINIKHYIDLFFSDIEIYEDVHHRTQYKDNIYNSILEFLKSKTEKSAYKVYESFFDAYWIGIQNKENPFLKLMDIMKEFEEHGGRLIERQRDHYIHSVYVFLLGLSIFSQDSNLRKIFDQYALDKNVYPDSYDTKNEEFFYRWGLASLFHDIAYPLEITLNQANEYLSFIWSYPEHHKVKTHIGIPDFEGFIKLPNLQPNEKFRNDYYSKYPKSKYKFYSDVISILSSRISINFSLSFSKVKRNIEQFLQTMKDEGFIDHGFYSAVIMLRWYYYLIKTSDWNPSYFYFPIVDSASSIMLHNYYKRFLMKPPFNLEKMRLNSHPIAYLLILCDELQEWNRKGYGKKNQNITCEGFEMSIDDKRMNLNYNFSEKRIVEKYKDLSNVIDIYDLFENGINLEHGG